MKDYILNTLRQEVAKELKLAQASFKSADELSKSDELKPDSKWDTRAIEAAYLAGAQEKRVKELELQDRVLSKFQFPESDQITIGSLITTQFDFEEKTFFISPATGGQKIKREKEVTILSSNSPLSKALIGMEEGDEIEFKRKGTQALILILAID